MRSCCPYLAISMELKARLSNGSINTSDLDPSRLVNGAYSKDRDLMVSVPQGSCAGANIF